MLRALLMIGLFLGGAFAQQSTESQQLVGVGLAPMPENMVKQVLGKRASKLVTIWVVVLRNFSNEQVAVSESWVLTRIVDLTPYDHKTLSPVIARASHKDPYATAGRVVADAAVLAAFFGTGGTIAMAEPVLAGLTGFVALSPKIIDRLSGEAIPVERNFEELSWMEPVVLDPGQVAVAHVFTAKQKDAHYRSYAESVELVPRVKLVR